MATAFFDVFILVAVVVREALLLDRPGFVPGVSHYLSHLLTADGTQVGGPAPGLEDAQARAEVALRVWVGAVMDS